MVNRIQKHRYEDKIQKTTSSFIFASRKREKQINIVQTEVSFFLRLCSVIKNGPTEFENIVYWATMLYSLKPFKKIIIMGSDKSCDVLQHFEEGSIV